MTEKPSSDRRTFTRDASRDEMRSRLRLIVGLAPEHNRKAGIAFAAQVLRLPYGLCKRLLYGEVQTIEAHLADQIRAYCDAASKLIEARQRYEKSRAEFLATASPGLARLVPPAISDSAVPVAEPTKVSGK